MAGSIAERQRAREICCCEGFRSSLSALLAARGVGESVPSNGGSGGEFFTPPRPTFPGKVPFPFLESQVIYTEKEEKITAGGVNSCSE